MMQKYKSKLSKIVKLTSLSVLFASQGGCNDVSQLQAILNATGAGVSTGMNQSAESANKGIKDLLSLSSGRASDYLGSASAWSLILPPEAQKVASTLRSVGLGSYVDTAQKEMDKAAGKAALAAAPVFKQAIQDMTITDAFSIWRGGSSAATQYFRAKTESQLRAKFSPIVQQSLAQTGYFDTYKKVLSAYNAIPFTSKPNIDIENYMLNKTMDGMFTKMAQEESEIRANPKAAGNALIQTLLLKLGR